MLVIDCLYSSELIEKSSLKWGGMPNPESDSILFILVIVTAILIRKVVQIFSYVVQIFSYRHFNTKSGTNIFIRKRNPLFCSQTYTSDYYCSPNLKNTYSETNKKILKESEGRRIKILLQSLLQKSVFWLCWEPSFQNYFNFTWWFPRS